MYRYVIISLATSLLLTSAWAQPSGKLITRGVDGKPSNGGSINPKISGDGSTICFQSNATNLSLNDNNDRWDTFFWRNKTLINISDTPTGVQGNRDSNRGCVLSHNGRYVAFATNSTNTDLGLSHIGGVVLLDTKTGDRLSFSGPQAGGPSDMNFHTVYQMSDNGGKVLYSAPTAYSTDEYGNDLHRLELYLWDKKTNSSTLLSKTTAGGPAGAANFETSMSANGRHIYFASTAVDITYPHLDEPAPFSSPYWYTLDMKTGVVTRFKTSGFISPDGSKIYSFYSKGIRSRFRTDPKFTAKYKVPFLSDPAHIITSVSNSGRYVAVNPDYGCRIYDTFSKTLSQNYGSTCSLSQDGAAVVFDHYTGGMWPDSIFDIYLRKTSLPPDAP